MFKGYLILFVIILFGLPMMILIQDLYSKHLATQFCLQAPVNHPACQDLEL